SHYHVCLAGADAGGSIGWLQYYEKATPVTLSDLEGLLQHKETNPERFDFLLIGSAFPDATLVPRRLANEKGLNTFLNTAPDRNIFADDIPEQDLQVVYTIPSTFYNLLNKEGRTRTLHVHSAAIKTLNVMAENYIALHFTSKEFRVLAVKNNQVQLAQIYPFTAPLDVVYYLLMISAQYHLPQSETVVDLSGLVDESSALYKELSQYYTHVQLAAPPHAAWLSNEYHPYYFSSIFNLAACASSVVS
ncbi:MAG: DUF3822 family protein, partial [Chitinophagaceae bacterium]